MKKMTQISNLQLWDHLLYGGTFNFNNVILWFCMHIHMHIYIRGWYIDTYMYVCIQTHIYLSLLRLIDNKCLDTSFSHSLYVHWIFVFQPYAYRFAWLRVVVYYSGEDLLAELWNYYGYYSYLLVKRSAGLKGKCVSLYPSILLSFPKCFMKL